MAKIILYSNDTIGEKMAGPGIRYSQMALALSKNHHVFLVGPKSSSFKSEDFQFKVYKKPKDIIPWLKKTDVIIAQKLPPILIKACRRQKIKFIADFYDPVVLENLEANRHLPIEQQVAIYDFEQASQTLQLAAADHILVASDRQRDFWLGILMQMGRIVPEVYSEDVSLNNIFSIVPFGISDQKQEIEDPKAIQKLVSNYSEKDKIILWGGGIWNWFDPLSVIEAIGKLEKTRPEIKLLFLGIKHPNPDAPEMAMVSKAVKLATDMGLIGKRVFFNYDWVPYNERHNIVLTCWAAVSTHFDHTETRLSFRTRIVDNYIWGGLPIVATVGDSLADLIEKRELGIIVDYTNSKEIAEAFKFLADNEDFYKNCQKKIKEIQPEFYWSVLCKPIDELLTDNKWPSITIDSKDLGRLIRRYYRLGAAKVLAQKGTRGIINKILKK